MKNRKMRLQVLLSMALVLSLILPASLLNTASVMAQGSVTPMVAAGVGHTVGLESDGTVVAVGSNYWGPCEVGGWSDIIKVAAGEFHTVGVKSDGTVVAVGDNSNGQCDVGNWTDITQVAAAAGGYHTVGVKSDGTVVAVGFNDYEQCEVGNWTDITQVAAGGGAWGASHTVGVKSDGTVVAVGSNWNGQCDVGGWTDITQVTAGVSHTVGLKSDGTVVAVGYNDDGQCDVGGWTDIVQVAAGDAHTVGLKSDGTVVAVGFNDYGQCDVGGWNLVLALPPPQEGPVAIKAGDWIKYKYTITGWPAGQPYAEWIKLEFLSVEGASANVRVTLHISDGTEESETMSVNLVEGGGEALGLAGFVISANLTTGDSVYMSGFGDIAIEGETTRTYAGARRTVVYASISESIPYQGDIQLTYYWDKLTGVMMEVSMTYPGMTATAKATETTMWEAGPPAVGMPWWPWIIVAVVVATGLVIFFMRRRGKGPADTSG